MKIVQFLENLLPLWQRKPAPLTSVEVDRDAFLRRAFQLWATDRNSDEAQEIFRALENSRAPMRRRAALSRVK
jgi:hypothetical protein